MPADIDSVIKMLNRNLKRGWAIVGNSQAGRLFINTYGHHPHITQIILATHPYKIEQISLFHASRADNATDGVLAFDWSIDRKDNTVCLYQNYHFLILGSLTSAESWKSWVEDLQDAFARAWKTVET